MRKFCTLASIFVFSSSYIYAAPAPTRLALSDVETATLASSPKFKAAEQDYQSALNRALSQRSGLSPKLSLEAMYRYQTVVPEFSPVPNAPAIKLGDNPNYSVGPQISWTIFSSGNIYQRWQAGKASARAARDAWDAAKRQTQLEARLAYFNVRLGLEQVGVLGDSLKLEESQYRDIRNKQRAGAASRIDELAAHQQVLNRRRDLRQAQADLASSLHSLSATSGLLSGVDVTVPTDPHLTFTEDDEVEAPTVIIEGDKLEQLSTALNVDAPRVFDDHHPSLLGLSETVESARRSAASLRSGYGPTIQVMGKVSRDYPNGPVLESFTQKTIGVSASWPIFEGGRTSSETKSEEAIANATEQRRSQSERDLHRDFDSAQSQLQSLRYQDGLNRAAVDENQTLAKLVYEAYRAGRSTYLEVEDANLRLLQARVQSARTKVEILMQVAVLDSLAKPLPEKESRP